MTYKINNTAFVLQPTNGRWLPRDVLEVDGAGYARYPALREFELQWEIVDYASHNQIVNMFESYAYTGTVVASLPQYTKATWDFANYSGCVLREPEWGEFFENHPTRVTLLITKINTYQSLG